MATVLRPLLATRIERRRQDSGFAVPNLLVSTLFVATIASSVSVPVERPERPQPELTGSFRALLEESPTPFAQSDFPNPAVTRPIIQVDALGTPRILFESLAVPFAQTDYPVPEVVRRRYDHDWIGTTQIVALSAAPQAFSQTDWPNPIPRPTYHESLAAPSLLDQVLAAAEVVARKPTYANVTARDARERQIAQVSSYLPLLEGGQTTPFSQLEWQTARRPEVVEAHTLFTVRYEPPLPDPFALRDWPTPPRKRAIDTTFPANLAPALLAESVVLPFALTEWPVVPKIERFQETPQPNVRSTLFVVPEPPFRQLDWPTAWRIVGRFDYNLPSRLETLPPPAIPFNQNEWVNPSRKLDPHADQWGQSLQHTTLFVENVKPFNQNDWYASFLFEPPELRFVEHRSAQLVSEGIGVLGLQPPHYVIGLMTTYGEGRYGKMTLVGVSVDGTMAASHAVDGSFDPSEGHGGSFL